LKTDWRGQNLDVERAIPVRGKLGFINPTVDGRIPFNVQNHPDELENLAALHNLEGRMPGKWRGGEVGSDYYKRLIQQDVDGPGFAVFYLGKALAKKRKLLFDCVLRLSEAFLDFPFYFYTHVNQFLPLDPEKRRNPGSDFPVVYRFFPSWAIFYTLQKVENKFLVSITRSGNLLKKEGALADSQH